VAVCLSTGGVAGATVVEPSPTPGSGGLPEGRVYEQVSPTKKNGNEAGPAAGGEGAYAIASPEGFRLLYTSTGPLGEATSGVENFSVGARGQEGWRTKAALPQPVIPPPPSDPISPFDPISLLPSSDLSAAAFTAHHPFSPAEVNFANPAFSFGSSYIANDQGGVAWMGAPTIEGPQPALEEVETPNVNLALVGAASDLSTVYYGYYGTLIGEDAPRAPTVAEGNRKAWGMYEWKGGQLKAAGLLPSGEEDPFGAVGAALGEQTLNATPPDFDNEVSENGSTVLFVSPAPEAESGRVPQLYARIDGARTVLVSRSVLTGLPSLEGPDRITGLSQPHISSYAFASSDGSRVFFASIEQLSGEAPNDTSVKEYEYDLSSEALRYLPGVTPPLLASSSDGRTFVFDDTHSGGGELAISSEGHVEDVATLPSPSEGELYVAPVRLSADSGTVVFQTNAAVPGFNNGGSLGEVYRYDAHTTGLTCVSCPGVGAEPVGGANLSNDALHQLTHLVVDSRGIADDGTKVFFDTPTGLVPQDTNGKRDVYEWSGGRVYLLSSGTGPDDALFLDNSASGSDAFFMTTAGLVAGDTDGGYDIYDARVGGGFPAAPAPVTCTSGCQGGPSPPPNFGNPASAGLSGGGNLPPPVADPHGKPSPHPLSRSQRLARSLRACRRLSGRRRRACEARARRRYGKHSAGSHA
jgi:hypothetical protein